MSWRELMKADPPTQYSQNTQKESKKAGFEDIEDIEHRNENKKTTLQVVHPKLQKKLWDIEHSLASSNGPHNLYHDQNTQYTQKPYTETELEVPVRQPHCPAYPNDGPHAGPTKEWCQQAMGLMEACPSCPWWRVQ